MPTSCCVPGCKGNYSNGPKVCTYKFPKDELLRKRWIVAIRRKDFNVTKYSSVCELHFKKTDFQTEASAFDPKTGRTITAPLSIRRLKKGVIPSILHTTSSSPSNRETPSEKRKRLETEQLALALEKSLKNAPEGNSQLEVAAEALSSSPALRPSEEENKEVKRRVIKQKRKTDADITSSKKVNRISSSSSVQQSLSNGILGISEKESSSNRNQESGSSSSLLPEVCVKEEPLWEAGYNISGNTSTNTPEDSIAENVQITSVRSLSNDSNAESPASVEENTVSKPGGSFDSTFYTKPVNIDQREKAFGSFIACEMSDLCENPELYMKTKQSILKILTEAHFEQMSSCNKS